MYSKIKSRELHIQVGMIISHIAFAVTIINLIQLTLHFSFVSALLDKSVYVVFISGLIIFLLSFSKAENKSVIIFRWSLNINLARLNKLIQIFIILLNGTLSILDTYDSFAGMGLMLITILLIYKYGMMNKMTLSLFLLYLVVIIEISAFYLNKSGIALDILLFTGLLFYIFYISFRDEVNKAISLNSIKDMEIIQLNKILESVITPNIDPAESGLTKGEMKVLRILCLYNASNKDISEKLNISVSTVKNHMGNIFNKTGADDRYQLIDLCKYHIIKNEHKNST